MTAKNSRKAVTPNTSTSRTKAYDERIKEKGGLRTSVVFTEKTLAACQQLVKEGYGATKSDVVNRALLEMTERHKKQLKRRGEEGAV